MLALSAPKVFPVWLKPFWSSHTITGTWDIWLGVTVVLREMEVTRVNPYQSASAHDLVRIPPANGGHQFPGVTQGLPISQWKMSTGSDKRRRPEIGDGTLERTNRGIGGWKLHMCYCMSASHTFIITLLCYFALIIKDQAFKDNYFNFDKLNA